MRDNRFNKNSKNNKKFKSREFDRNDRSDFRGKKNEYRSNDFKKKEYKKDNRRFEEKEYNKNEYRRDNRKVENKKDEEKLYEDIVEGRNPVLELLESGKDINKIFIQAGEKNGSITRKDAENLIQKEKTTTATILNKLVENKVLVKVGNGPSTRYEKY